MLVPSVLFQDSFPAGLNLLSASLQRVKPSHLSGVPRLAFHHVLRFSRFEQNPLLKINKPRGLYLSTLEIKHMPLLRSSRERNVINSRLESWSPGQHNGN